MSLNRYLGRAFPTSDCVRVTVPVRQVAQARSIRRRSRPRSRPGLTASARRADAQHEVAGPVTSSVTRSGDIDCSVAGPSTSPRETVDAPHAPVRVVPDLVQVREPAQ